MQLSFIDTGRGLDRLNRHRRVRGIGQRYGRGAGGSNRDVSEIYENRIDDRRCNGPDTCERDCLRRVRGVVDDRKRCGFSGRLRGLEGHVDGAGFSGDTVLPQVWVCVTSGWSVAG